MPAGIQLSTSTETKITISTDLSFEVVQPLGLGAGLVDNKVCAIDDVWSGLRLVVRLADRAAWNRT